jgi:hypothetical protein
MSIQMKKVWFDPNTCELNVQEIPEAEIYMREWVGLTQQDIDKAWEWAQKDSRFGIERIDSFAEAIEAKLKEKNT